MNYSMMSNDGAADALAHDEGKAQAYDDARHDYAEQYVESELERMKRYPLADDQSMWHKFAGRQAHREDPLNNALSRLLVRIAMAGKQEINLLSQVGLEYSDAALLIRDDLRDMLLIEGSEQFDEIQKRGTEVDCD